MKEKPLVWLKGEIKTPPFSSNARIEAGFLLRQLQRGMSLTMPYARPMEIIGKRCYELRIKDMNKIWRIIYRTDNDAIIMCEVFKKQTEKTPKKIISVCKQRLKFYDSIKYEEIKKKHS